MDKYDLWQKTNNLVELEWYHDKFLIDANESFRNAFFLPVVHEDIRDAFMDMRLVKAMIAYREHFSLKELADYLMSLESFSNVNIKEVTKNDEKYLQFSRKDERKCN